MLRARAMTEVYRAYDLKLPSAGRLSLNAAFKRETLQGAGSGTTTIREARLAAFGWLHRYNTDIGYAALSRITPCSTSGGRLPQLSACRQLFVCPSRRLLGPDRRRNRGRPRPSDVLRSPGAT